MVDTRPMALERARKRAAERKAQRDALQENSPVQTARPAGNGFESERQRAKTELRNELETYDGTGVHKIAASADRQQEDRILNVAAYCRVSTDDIEQTIPHGARRAWRRSCAMSATAATCLRERPGRLTFTITAR